MMIEVIDRENGERAELIDIFAATDRLAKGLFGDERLANIIEDQLRAGQAYATPGFIYRKPLNLGS